MVQIAHTGGNDEKIGEILRVAQSRFGIYGYSKTTMQEIADDMGISKALLYYYYPDKDQLFRAVFEREQGEFIDNLKQLVQKNEGTEKLLSEFLVLRLKNFKKFFNLGRASFEELKGIRKIVKDLWIAFRERELQEIAKIFVKAGYKKDKSSELAILYLDVIRGLAHVYIKSKDISHFNEDDYLQLTKKIEYFNTIFIKGISQK